MEADTSGAGVFKVDAVLDALAGLVLILGTWDGLYRALDLPHQGPALLAQLGGAALLGFAYLLWAAADTPTLRRPVGLAAAVANGLGALIIAAWLIFRSEAELSIGTQGFVELLVLGLVLAGFAVVQARAATSGTTGRQASGL